MTRRTGASITSAESSGAATSNATTVKTRRSHRKSRNGCAECKRRHIRCDERQPSCANCEAAEHTCSFLKPQVGKQRQKEGSQRRVKLQQQRRPEATAARSPARSVHNADGEHAEQPSPLIHQQNSHPELDQVIDQLSHRSSSTQYAQPHITSYDTRPHQVPSSGTPVQLSDVHTPPADCCPGLLNTPDVVPKALFTPQHMILLHHADRVPNFSAPNRSVVDIAIRHVVGSPYLMDEVLAFTAFHMSHLYPGSAAYLRCLASELQNRALVSFTRVTEIVPVNDKATAVPRFLFSGILGRHVLADALTYSHSDFHLFIDRFVECINLNRGIRSVTPPAWDFLNNTEIEPFLGVVLEAQKKITSPGHECDSLSHLMEKSDLNDVSIEACVQAIEILQWSFDLCHGLDEDDYLQAASVFSVRIEAAFVDVLRKHQPEALIILAYYGVLLYRCRSFWAFSDAGASMIHAIARQLGSYWQEALVWPLHMLKTERSPLPQAPDV